MIEVVLAVGQAIDVFAAEVVPKGVGVALVGCMSPCVVDDRSGAVGAVLGNRRDWVGSATGGAKLTLGVVGAVRGAVRAGSLTLWNRWGGLEVSWVVSVSISPVGPGFNPSAVSSVSVVSRGGYIRFVTSACSLSE